MARNTLYLGQASGAGVLAVGGGVISQVGTNYQMDFTTWPLTPGGPAGDCLFRVVTAVIEATGGYNLGITPIVDGVSQDEQTFSGGTTGRVECQAFVAVRGASIAARVRTLARVGPVRVQDVTTAHVVLRATP